jgi:hypothetical protein
MLGVIAGKVSKENLLHLGGIVTLKIRNRALFWPSTTPIRHHEAIFLYL